MFLALISFFFLFETILSWSFCVHSHNLHRRIQTFEDCILNVWKYIHNEAIQVRSYYYIALLALEWGEVWGSMIKGVIYTGNAELWSTCSMHDYLPWLVSVNLWKLGKEFSNVFVKYTSQKYTLVWNVINIDSSKHFYGSRTSTL